MQIMYIESGDDTAPGDACPSLPFLLISSTPDVLRSRGKDERTEQTQAGEIDLSSVSDLKV